jgi:hypothetical protein
MTSFFQLQHRVAHPYQHQQSPAKYPGRVIARVSLLVFHYFVAKEPVPVFVHLGYCQGASNYCSFVLFLICANASVIIIVVLAIFVSFSFLLLLGFMLVHFCYQSLCCRPVPVLSGSRQWV